MAKAKSEQLFNEFADVKALEDQQKRILKIYDELLKKHEKVSNLTIQIGTGQSIKAVTDAEVQYNAAFKEVNKLQKEYAANEAKMQIYRSKEYDALVTQKQALAELRKEQELRIKLRNAEEGSLEQMNLKLQKATKIINSLTEAQRNTAKGQGLIKFAGDLSNSINEIQKKAGNFKANVGRYAESLAGGFEKVREEIEKLKTKQQGLQNLSQSNPIGFKLSGGDTELKKTTAAIQQLETVAQIGFRTNQSYSQSVKQIEKAYQNLATSGNVADDFLQEFKKFAAEAKDQAQDLKDEIKALSSDTRNFDLIAGSISTLAAGFEVAAGAEALFGTQSEDIQKSIQKLIAVQSVANGVREVANQLTKKGTAANIAYSFVQKQVNIVMTEGIATANGLKAAMGLLGIIATVVGGIAVAYSLMNRSVTSAQQAQKNYNDVLKEAQSSYTQAVQDVGLLRNEIDAAKKGFISKSEVVKHYNETIGKTTGQVKSLEEAEKSLQANSEAYIQFMLLKAAATIALQKAGEEAFKIQEKLNNTTRADITPEESMAAAIATQDLQKELNRLAKEDAVKNAEKIEQLKQEIHEKSLKTIRGKDIKSNEEQKKSFEQIATDLFKQATDLSKKFKFDFFGGQGDGDKKETDIADRRAKAILEAKKRELEGVAEIQRQIVSIETFSFDDRLAAYSKYVEAKGKIIDLEAEYELSKSGLLDEEKINIRKKAEADKIKVAEEASQLLAKVLDKQLDKEEETLADIEEVNKQASEKLGDTLQAGFEKAVKIIDEQGAKLKEATSNLSNEIQGAFFNAIVGVFDSKKNAIQEQIDDIERLKQAEIDRINGTSESEEKKAARIKILEAKAQADREALERRQRRIDTQRAIFERTFKAAQITFEGIKTVGAIKLELAKAIAEAATNPFMAAAIPLISSQIPIAIGTTAAQLVSLLATPIPKFWTGTNFAPEGYAEIAERGRELTKDPQGNWALYDKPGVAYLKKGTKVYNNKVTEEIIASISTNERSWELPNSSSRDGEIVEQLKQLNNKPTGSFKIVNEMGVESKIWYQNQIKN